MGVEAKKFIDKGELVPDELPTGSFRAPSVQDDVKDGFGVGRVPGTRPS